MKKITTNKKLTKKQLKILENKETEPPFSGKFLYNKKQGIYSCAKCGNKLFSSDTKFDSKSGWPSFFDVFDQKMIKSEQDDSNSMKRTEIHCAKCGGHLGHVFDDGPNPTGKRYCVNSLSLDFTDRKEIETQGKK